MMKKEEKILEKALKLYKPRTIVISYSGGYDSQVAGHIATIWARKHAHSANIKTIAADTGVSADGWRDYVVSSAKQIGLPNMSVWRTEKLDEWSTRMAERGFSHTRSQHKINFYYLKQSVFRRIVAAHKNHNHDRILFVNGVRRSESAHRAGAPEYGRNGNFAYCNPILHWTEEDIAKYRTDNDFPINPFYDEVGNSGDCLCNWHARLSADDVKRIAPDCWNMLEEAHVKSVANFGYGYGQKPRPGTFGGTHTQMKLPGFDETPDLCNSCEKPGVGEDARNFVALQRYKW